jgi:hypothetical protein
VAIIVEIRERIRRAAEIFGKAPRRRVVFRPARRLGRQLDAVWPLPLDDGAGDLAFAAGVVIAQS